MPGRGRWVGATPQATTCLPPAITQKEFSVSDSDSILAYETANAIEAHALVAFLANEGVEARVLGEALQGAFGGIEAGTLDTVEVWVAAADRAKAQPLIDQWRQEYDEPKA
jgi:hypothetical protein